MSPPAPIDTYLARVDEALWLRRRARRDVLEELRGHLETLDETARRDADTLAREFGEPALLARRIAAERPWWQTTAPWRPTVYLFAYLVVGLMAQICLRGHDADTLANLISWSDVGAIAVATAAAARRMIHPLHVVMIGMWPALLVTMLMGGALACNGPASYSLISVVLTTLASLLIVSLGITVGPALLASPEQWTVRGRRLRVAAAVAAASVAYLASLGLSGAATIEVGHGWIGMSTHGASGAHVVICTAAFGALACASAWLTLRGRERAMAARA